MLWHSGGVTDSSREVNRRWRDYATPAARRPVREFINSLSDEEAAIVLDAMREVREKGNQAGRHLDGDIWEVRADGERVIYRILYANEGSKNRILLALEGFTKKTRKTPPAEIRLAKRRLSIWRGEGEARKKAARRAARRKRS